ncbi:site-specific integrase [Salinibacter ruber]|uniref:Core-binding (CB) domain-containing protein n=1 Tax=Salinibacter ruber TaxID=146919 RepID=A0A9X2UK85_9BACT|nr:hypothetical protein [Salinibacter ruber]MCS4035840.1 hypothetical protein [Salinibacter ruber]MCS4195492.1 hypothetical protein [Salinibacter ruber]
MSTAYNLLICGSIQTGSPHRDPHHGRLPPDDSSPLLNRVRTACRRTGYTHQTEKTYRRWIVRYVKHHGTEHPCALGKEKVRDYLSRLAIGRNVAAATQNQALNAFLFLHRDVLGAEWGAASDVDRAKEPERRPQKRGHQTAPPLPVGRAEGGRSASRRDRHHQVGRLSHALTLVCTRSPGAGCRPPNGPRTPWPPDLRTTQVYTHVLQDGQAGTRCPLEGIGRDAE